MHSGKMDMGIQFELLRFSGFRIIINYFILIVIEMDNAVRFASEVENNYK
jgi:hypothetical protein